ncbi:MAG: potassium channel family protein [Gammaproteobacteria bacterium]
MRLVENKIIKRFRFSFLVLVLLSLYIVVPFFDISFLTDLVVSFLFIAALAAVTQNSQLFWLTLVLAVFTISLTWGSYWSGNEQLAIIARTFQILFVVLIAGAILSQIFTHKKITRETVAGAICVYLLMGTMWADVYGIMEIVQPGTFPAYETAAGEIITDPHLRSSQFHYFSFVTLSTLGYGDITPTTREAQSLASMEAIIGQLFLAVLIARLVGQQVSYREKED